MELGSPSKDSLFSPNKQSEFWGSVTPDVRGLLQFFEMKENWTVPYNELPEFYQSLDRIIKSIKLDSEDVQNEQVLDKLIMIFGSMPLRQCMAGLSWLDKGIENENEIKWAGGIYFRSADITNEGHPDQDIEKHAWIIKERIELISRMNLLNSLFSKINV